MRYFFIFISQSSEDGKVKTQGNFQYSSESQEYERILILGLKEKDISHTDSSKDSFAFNNALLKPSK